MTRALSVLIIVSTLWLTAGGVVARDLYVATNAVPAYPYNSWSSGFTNMLEALDYAESGDTIYVAAHTFSLTNTLVWNGLTDIRVLGGYSAVTDDPLPGDRTLTAGGTVLLRPADTPLNFRIMTIGAVTNAVLDGFTLTGGRLLGGGTGMRGGAMDIAHVGGLRILNCVVEQNNVFGGNSAWGGAIYLLNASIVISNSYVQANRANGSGGAHGFGGGLFVHSGNLDLIDSQVCFNRATTDQLNKNIQGGGLYVAGGTVRLRNTLFAGNTAESGGGAVWVAGGTVVGSHLTVAYNGHGGWMAAGGQSFLTNSIVWGNRFRDVEGSADFSPAGSLIGTPDFSGTAGCLSADPLFEHGYYLSDGSPAINRGVGTASSWGLDSMTTDVTGSPDTGTVNLGYHYPSGFDQTYADLYVDPSGNDAQSGLTPDQPLQSITRALELARDGTRFHLATGHYSTAAEVFPLVLDDLHGLWLNGVDADNTRIDAIGADTRVAWIHNCAGPIRISGVTLTGGNTTGSGGSSGGGALRVENVADLTITDSVIASNTISDGNIVRGGAILMWESGLRTERVLFRDNIAGKNHVPPSGGAIHLRSGTADFRDTVFRDNLTFTSTGAARRGGALFMTTGWIRFFNCLFSGNVAADGGAAVFIDGGHAAFLNVTAAYNVGVDAVRRAGGTFSVTNSILYANETDVNGLTDLGYSIIGDGTSHGVDGCISNAPILQFGFYLGDGSPARNAGTGTAAFWGLDTYTTRPDGIPDDGTVDMGYHYAGGVDRTYAAVYVAGDGDDANAGTNRASPFRSLTRALSVSADGTVIHVAAGDYTPAVETFPLTVQAIGTLTIAGVDPESVVIDATGNATRVFEMQNNAGTVRLSGLTLQGGDSLGYWGAGAGGGIWADNTAELVFENCRLIGNLSKNGSGTGYGGALFANNTVVTLTDSRVVSNEFRVVGGGGSGRGGAMYVQNGSLTIHRSRITHNRCISNSHDAYGGGIAVGAGVTLQITDSLIAGNQAMAPTARIGTGGGLHLAGPSLIRQTVVADNMTSHPGGGMHVGAGAALSLQSSTVAINTTNAIRRTGGTVDVINSILWGNGDVEINGDIDAIGYSLIGDGSYAAHDGVIAGDPAFVDADGWDFRLRTGWGRRDGEGLWIHDSVTSPAIDAGTNQAWMAAATDADGRQRIIKGKFTTPTQIVDMGPYESEPRARGSVISLR